MSFILDALKKSESERQRQNAPGIASIPQQTRQKSSSGWIWIVAILLTINIVAVGALLLWKESAPEAQQTAALEPIEQYAATTTTPVAAAQAEASETLTTPATDAPPAATLPLDDAAPAPATSAAGSAADGLETFNDLRAKGQLQLPDMHLDIHVYSGTPADRFVFVNMSKYKENTTLSEGPQIQAITPEGVVLEYQNLRFLLPRE